MDTQVFAFTWVAILLTLTPGADTMLVIRSALARGQRAGLLTMFGICCGLFVHATLSALGLSVILVQSAEAFEVVKWLGAGYLVFLGAQSLWEAVRGQASTATQTSNANPQPNSCSRNLAEGFLNNLLNPKVAVFYLAFLPQFISPGDPVLAKSLLLAGIHFALGIVWLTLVVVLAARFQSVLAAPRVKRVFNGVAGLVFLGFGVRLALERR